MTDEQFKAQMDERIIARRVRPDELYEYLADKVEYINYRMIVKSTGIELFVGVKEFPESIKALKERPDEYWESVYGDE